MDPLFLFIFVGCILSLAVLVPRLMISRARKFLDRWAAQNGYEVVSSGVRILRKGPYFLKSTRNQIVLRITVRDSSDEIRTGYARCGSHWKGLFVDEVDVTLDEPDAEASEK